METQQAFSVPITNLAKRIDFLATHLERITVTPSSFSSSNGAAQHQRAAHAPHRLRLAPLNLEAIIDRQTQLHVLSYSSCPLCQSPNSTNLQYYSLDCLVLLWETCFGAEASPHLVPTPAATRQLRPHPDWPSTIWRLLAQHNFWLTTVPICIYVHTLWLSNSNITNSALY